jgi:hypothetical protein
MNDEMEGILKETVLHERKISGEGFGITAKTSE